MRGMWGETRRELPWRRLDRLRRGEQQALAGPLSQLHPHNSPYNEGL